MKLWPFGKSKEKAPVSQNETQEVSDEELRSQYAHLFSSDQNEVPQNDLSTESMTDHESEKTGSFGRSFATGMAATESTTSETLNPETNQEWNTGSTFGLQLPGNSDDTSEPQEAFNISDTVDFGPDSPSTATAPWDNETTDIIFEEPVSKVQFISDEPEILDHKPENFEAKTDSTSTEHHNIRADQELPTFSLSEGDDLAPPNLELNTIDINQFEMTDSHTEITEINANTVSEDILIETDIDTYNIPSTEAMDLNEQYMAGVLVDKNLDWGNNLLAASTPAETTNLNIDPLLQVANPQIPQEQLNHIDPLLQAQVTTSLQQKVAHSEEEALQPPSMDEMNEETSSIHLFDDIETDEEYAMPIHHQTNSVTEDIVLEDIDFDHIDQDTLSPPNFEATDKTETKPVSRDTPAPKLSLAPEKYDINVVAKTEAEHTLESDAAETFSNQLETYSTSALEIEAAEIAIAPQVFTLDEPEQETYNTDDLSALTAYTGSDDEFAKKDQAMILNESRYVQNRINNLVEGYFGKTHSS